MHQPDLHGGAGAIHAEPDLKMCSQWLMRPCHGFYRGPFYQLSYTGKAILKIGATGRLVLPMSGYSSRACDASHHGC